MVGAEGGLLDTCGMNPNMMVAGVEVELCEELGASKFIHDWNWVLVLDRLVVERTVISAKSPRVILLLDVSPLVSRSSA